MTRQLRKLYVALFLAVLALLFVWSARNLLSVTLPPDTSVLDGKWAKAVESHYDKEFPVKRLGTNVWAALDYLLFGEGRPGVIVGRNDWLFSDEEFKPVVNGEQNIADNLALVRGVRDQLARQNIKLVLAIVPAKSRLYPEYLDETQPVAMRTRLYEDFHAAAERAGILAPDLLKPLEQAKSNGEVFLRTDTHWTPMGAEVVAQTLGRTIRGDALLSSEPQQFVTETGEIKPHKGDLLNFLPLDPLFSDLLPPADKLQQRSTHPANDGEAGGDALFADTEVPVALVGTSYSANERWNFPGALRQSLASDLVNHAEDGRGPLLPMLKFLQSEEFKSAPPQVVVWEFPERYLPMQNDLSDFDPSWIAELKKAGTAESLASTAGKTATP
ncbi:alginate O-acetyltransferase [Pseudomonas sp. PIC25]|uniref:alginate O-acetyltransferase n=1 Tax=Pseudomonas sp. PIC25 TaxID=1958773 RepID=UPI000BABAC53|nr:alginate O-acetyltransferase [Pseudomonas sp. PIC25]PAU56694.1 alginate O-acetyltransferase [Pseudomonas sp. PIC25]